MIICSCILHLDLYDVHSLKGRRSVLNRLKEKLKTFNVSIMDISGEYPKEAEMAFLFLSPDRLEAARYREKIENSLLRLFPEYTIELDFEEL
ncbi:MAG: DUF503 family protein [Campylobacterota bacterium]|nr:DUF503 family protein [Campylobacterota bacterium]